MTDYNPLIPQPNDNLSTSQGQILNNFTQLNDIINFDHFNYNFSTVSERGLHRKVSFPENTTVSAPTGVASVLYSKAVSGVSSPYFDNAVGSSVLWRGGSTNGLISQTTGGTPSSGRMTLPNGIIFIWGVDTGPIVDNYQVNFQGGGFPTACFSVNITGTRSGNALRSIFILDGTLTKAKFNITTASTGFNAIYYFAVGN